jgi:hypothetical protein
MYEDAEGEGMRGSKAKRLRKEAGNAGLAIIPSIVRLGKTQLMDVPGSDGLMIDVTPTQLLGSEARQKYQQLKRRRQTR